MFTCTSCLLASTNLYHPSPQFFYVHYTPVPPFPQLWPLHISFTSSHNPLETSFKFAFSYETYDDLISPLLVNYQVLSEALQGYTWAAPYVAHPSVSCPESSLSPLSTSCQGFCISVFNLLLSQSCAFVFYAESHSTDILKSQTSGCHTQCLNLLPLWSLLLLFLCIQLITGVTSWFQEAIISLLTQN